MNSSPTKRLKPQQPSKNLRFARVRAMMETRRGRVISLVVALVAGLLLGVLLTLLTLFAFSGDHAPLQVPSARTGNITVQIDPVFLSHLVENSLHSSGLPGTIKDVQVVMVHGEKMTITGNDDLSLLGVATITKQFTLVIQPYVNTCQLQIHITHADLGGIPVTGFMALFESRFNQQLQPKLSGLPESFAYCASGVHTEQEGLFVSYTATPV